MWVESGLFDNQSSKGTFTILLNVLYIHICNISVGNGDTFGYNKIMIPAMIAKNREFGANLVGKYFPRIVPFGPFGFYENLYSTNR